MEPKKKQSLSSSAMPGYQIPGTPDNWQAIVTAVATRYNREYRGDGFDLPPEVEAMSVFREWAARRLQSRIGSPFWELSRPQKKQHWLDIGCGLSFLIYPWREWDAFFYGLEISAVARDALQSRGPQLNSKLFRGVELGAAHQRIYDPQQFDGVIATGWSCYFPLEYWQIVLDEIKRILKPGGVLLVDILNLESPLAEDWAILETYLGTEVLLTSLEEWKPLIRKMGGTLAQTSEGELFQLLKIRF